MADIKKVNETEPGKKYLYLGEDTYDVTDVPQEEQEALIAEYVRKKRSYNPVTETK